MNKDFFLGSCRRNLDPQYRISIKTQYKNIINSESKSLVGTFEEPYLFMFPSEYFERTINDKFGEEYNNEDRINHMKKMGLIPITSGRIQIINTVPRLTNKFLEEKIGGLKDGETYSVELIGNLDNLAINILEIEIVNKKR